LSQKEFQGTSDLFHCLGLVDFTLYEDTFNCAAEPTRETERPTLMAGRIPRKNNSASKKICPDIRKSIADSTISDTNDVGWNVSGHITTLGFNDGKRSQTSATEFVVHLGGTFE
jgi:hypothetical protein